MEKRPRPFPLRLSPNRAPRHNNLDAAGQERRASDVWSQRATQSILMIRQESLFLFARNTSVSCGNSAKLKTTA